MIEHTELESGCTEKNDQVEQTSEHTIYAIEPFVSIRYITMKT